MSSVFTIDQTRCTFCAGCSSVCPVLAIEILGDASRITERCTGCGRCQAFCPVDAVEKMQKEKIRQD
jgi:formate hydrogenlyase subunit 6/NADH:ubiquinone oxidoreductase subunit I